MRIAGFFELLAEVIIESAVVELLNRLSYLFGKGIELHPNQESTANMIVLNPRFVALARF